MKPIADCNCTMAGAARWIAPSERDGRRQEKEARLKSETPGSSAMLSHLNGYRARRSRSTSLFDCIGRFTERRMAALDEQFRLLTSAATDSRRIAQHARLLTSAATVVGRFSPGNEVGPARVPALRQMCKTNPNDGRAQNRKTSFFQRNANISIPIQPP